MIVLCVVLAVQLGHSGLVRYHSSANINSHVTVDQVRLLCIKREDAEADQLVKAVRISVGLPWIETQATTVCGHVPHEGIRFVGITT